MSRKNNAQRHTPENREAEIHIFVEFGLLVFRTNIQTEKDSEEKFFKVKPLDPLNDNYEAGFVDRVINESKKDQKLTPFSQCLREIDGVVSGYVHAYGFEVCFVPTFSISDIIFDVLDVFCNIFQVTVPCPAFSFVAPKEEISEFDLRIFLNDLQEICEDFSLSFDSLERKINEHAKEEAEENKFINQERAGGKNLSRKIAFRK